ncbi:MAG: hypothetical protein EXS13_07165 [Planctomycetes bacterium]|nr:hypothetical protein [Planctomycetota bacterium]
MARKKKHEEHENAERWLVSYADFITLLFAFFTVLYAMGQSEKGKMESAMQSIRTSFLSGGGLFSDDGNTFLPSLRPGAQGSGASDTETALDKIAAKMGEARGGAGESNQGGSPFEVTRDDAGLLIRLNDEINFTRGRPELKPEAKQALEDLGTKIRDLNVPVQVIGYAGRDAFASDSKAYNLGLDRAIAVVKFMSTTVPFFTEHVTIEARTEPAAASAAKGQSHRRVELFLKVSDEDVKRLVSSLGK